MIISYFNKELKRFSEKLSGLQEKIEQENPLFLSEFSKAFEEKVNSFLIDICKKIEKNQTRKEVKLLKKAVLDEIGQYVFTSLLFRRFYEKPRGYPGDYLMFEMIYDRKILSKNIGFLFDQYVFNHYLIIAVVSRKEKMKELILKVASKFNQNHQRPFRLLNVACGPTKELRELMEETNLKITGTLLDQDREALDFSEKKFKNMNHSFMFVENNVIDLLGITKKSINGLGKYDLIYSMGLVDYFLDNVLIKFVNQMLTILNTKGQIIIAACSDRRKDCYLALRWLCDWDFYIRNAEETKRLIEKNIKNCKVSIVWEANKQIFFIVIDKKS
jgi:hypothetical protein